METLMYIAELCGRMILLSGVLTAVYFLFIRRRADYRHCRRVLLAMPLLCLALPALYFASLKLSAAFSEPRQVVLTRSEADDYLRSASEGDAAAVAAARAFGQAVAKVSPADSDRLRHVAEWTVPAISALLLLLMAAQLAAVGLRCRRISRRGTLANGIIVSSADVDTPFSFGRRIYMPSGRLTNASEQIVIEHELAHLQLGHQAEGLMMEALCRLLWFNPFIWLARKELRDVQEFEADRQVLNQGTEILTYQTLLLEETMKGCPVFADGLNRSFVRRRFVEMRSAGRRGCSTALKGLTVVLIAGMTAMASAGTGRSNVELKIVDDIKAQPEAETTPAAEAPAIAAAKPCLPQPAEASGKTPAPAAPATKGKYRPTVYHGYPVLYSLPTIENQTGSSLSIRHTDSETFLEYRKLIKTDPDFVKFGGPGSYIVDCATGIHYEARRSIPAEAWNCFVLADMKDKVVAVTVVFPRLPDSVEEIALYGITSDLESDRRFMVSALTNKY